MTPPRVGNDVVDLADPGMAGKSRDRRFLARVFTPAEQAWIAGRPDPDRALWRLWAAKEAVFKAARLPVFAHSRLEVLPEEGEVACQGVAWPVEWHEGPGWIHCLVRAPGPRVLWRVEARRGEHSPAVRALARRLLAEAGFAGAEVVREPREPGSSRLGPPEVVLAGRRLDEVAVSLSHDGDWVAVAVAWVGPKEGSPAVPGMIVLSR